MTFSAQVGPSPAGGGPVAFQDRDELLADVGDRIRAERHARGWSQTVLGQRCGLSWQAIKRMEGGETTMPLLTLASVCCALGVELSELLSAGWEMPARPERSALTATQVRVLRVAASGLPLLEVGRQVGMSRQSVAARLSEAYRALGVSDRPRDERRAAAVRVAEARGLLDDAREVDAA